MPAVTISSPQFEVAITPSSSRASSFLEAFDDVGVDIYLAAASKEARSTQFASPFVQV